MASFRIRFLLVHLALGVGAGLVFPFVASALEVLRLELPLNLPRILEAYGHIPLVLKLIGPTLLGLIGLFVARLSLKRIREQEVYAARLLEQAEDLKKQNQALTELNEMLDSLVYTASHDLKTPVVNFKSLIAMLRSVKDRPNSGKMVEDILDKLDHSSDRFLATIADLLNVSRVSQDSEEALTRVEIARLVDDVVQDMGHLVKSTNAKIVVEVAAAPALMIQESRLHSILQNLIGNALKYVRPGVDAVIEVRSQVHNDHFSLSVSDNGVGIDLSKFGGKLFKMFSRLHDAKGDGNGIGLFIVKRTVEKLGGRIEVRSEVGVGTTFEILLPNNFIAQP